MYTKETLGTHLALFCKQLKENYPEQALRIDNFITIDSKQFKFTVDLVFKEIKGEENNGIDLDF